MITFPILLQRPFKDQGKSHYHNSNFSDFREFWKKGGYDAAVFLYHLGKNRELSLKLFKWKE